MIPAGARGRARARDQGRRDTERRDTERRDTERRDTERGATSLELALLTPILITVILFVVQLAMLYHAEHVALAAAQAGARVARGDASSGWAAAAQSKAESYAQQIGRNIVTNVQATPSGGADERFVDVEADAITVIPGHRWHVHQRAGGPTECFRPDRDGGVSCEPQP